MYNKTEDELLKREIDYGVVAIQCKNYQDMSVSISMIDQWIQGAEEFKPEISHFIIAIGAKTDGEIQKYVLEKNQYRQSHNLFSVEVVYWEEISAFLKSDARILQRYYPFINTDGKVQPSNNGQYVRMNQVLMEDYEEIEAIVQRMKSEICEIYESISQ